MMLKNKVALIVGGSGAIGSAVARAMLLEGAKVFIAARNPEKLERIADDLRAAGGEVGICRVDVLDETLTKTQFSQLAQQTGGFDIVVNATGFMHDQGKRLAELSLSEFRQGYDPFLTALFTIAKTVTPHMGKARGGTLISVVAPAATMAMPGHAGHIVGCAGVEALSKALASELAPSNIRVICLRSHAVADAVQAGSYTGEVFTKKAQAMGITVDQFLTGAAQSTLLKRLPTLSQVAGVITFLASDDADAITATVVNLTGGATLS